MKLTVPILTRLTFVPRVFLALMAVLILIPATSRHASAACGTTNIAPTRPITASSSQSGLPATAANDANTGTRWGSNWSDPQWVQIDLGTSRAICRVVLRWEAAYARSYQIQVSSNASTWTTIYSTTTGDGGVDDLTGLVGTGRYIRMNGTARATSWGYSLWEFEVYADTGTVTPTPTNTPTSTPTRTPSVTPSRTPTFTLTPGTPGTGQPPTCNTTNAAQGRPATASSSESAAMTANYAVDGNAGTRWSSTFSDPQWIYVDLGTSRIVCRVVLRWEGAYGRSYQIQTSNDAVNWTNIYTTTTGDGGVDDITTLSGSGRYVRMHGTVRGTAYGYSLWEFEIYTTNAVSTITPTFTPTASRTPTATNTPTRTPSPTVGTPSGCGTANAALNKSASASSSENAASTASFAIDGNAGTRWSSLFSDPQWLQVDLGASLPICRVRLSWEAAYGSAYRIEISSNGTSWSPIYTTMTGDGGIDDLTNLSGTGRYIRMYGTTRATAYGYSLWEMEVYTVDGQNVTPTPTPTMTGGDAFWGDRSNIPAAQNVLMFKFINRTNGRYADNQIFWSFNGITRSIAEAPTFDMPANSAGRMYFYLGAPNSQYEDFIEFTIGPNQFNGNTTRVDWFGIKLAMLLHTDGGEDIAVGEDLETFQEDRAVTFQKFVNEVPAEFKHLGQIQAPYRIPAPGKMGDTAFTPTGIYKDYYTAYANSVGVTNANIFDILACAGTLGNNPQLCAALNRHVAHLPVSQQADPSLYYQTGPANYYSKFWHDHSINKLSYGFPYDDWEDQSSFIVRDNPQYLLIAIGW